MFTPRTIATSIDAIARHTLGKDWGLYEALLRHWQEIVGAEYASQTTPVKINFPPNRQSGTRREAGVLTIRLPQGLAMEFGFKTTQIISRINSYFGYPAIAKIGFETVYGAKEGEIAKKPATPLSPETIENLKNQIKHIDNDGLRNSLEALGQSIIQERNC